MCHWLCIQLWVHFIHAPCNSSTWDLTASFIKTFCYSRGSGKWGQKLCIFSMVMLKQYIQVTISTLRYHWVLGVQLATVLYENKSLAVCLAFIPGIQVCKSEFLSSALNFACQLTPKPNQNPKLKVLITGSGNRSIKIKGPRSSSQECLDNFQHSCYFEIRDILRLLPSSTVLIASNTCRVNINLSFKPKFHVNDHRW